MKIEDSFLQTDSFNKAHMRFEDVKMLSGYATLATELIEMSYDVVSDQDLVATLIQVMDDLINEL